MNYEFKISFKTLLNSKLLNREFEGSYSDRNLKYHFSDDLQEFLEFVEHKVTIKKVQLNENTTGLRPTLFIKNSDDFTDILLTFLIK